MTGQERTYVTMADKSIGQCSSGYWLPLRGNCELCGAGPRDKCRFSVLVSERTAHDQGTGRHGRKADR